MTPQDNQDQRSPVVPEARVQPASPEAVQQVDGPVAPPPAPQEPEVHPFLQACIGLRAALRGEPRHAQLDIAFHEFDDQLRAILHEDPAQYNHPVTGSHDVPEGADTGAIR